MSMTNTTHTSNNIAFKINKFYIQKLLTIESLVKSKYADDWHFSYSYHTMLKSIILMRLENFKFLTQLVVHLKKNEQESLEIGFFKDEMNRLMIPDRRTFSYFIKHRLDEQINKIMDQIVFWVKEDIIDSSMRLDITSPSNSYKNVRANIQRNSKPKLTEACRFIKKHVYPFIELQLHNNAIYTKNNFLDMLVHTSMTQDFTENGSKTFSLVNPNPRSPNADTLLYHIKKYKRKDEIEQLFEKVFNRTFKIAKSSGMFSRAIDLAIDFTDILYYGNKNDDMVMERKPERGTSHCYRFATINVVVAGERYTIFALPVDKFDKKEDIVRKLITYAQRKVRIRSVYLDRGFFNVNVIKTLKKLNVEFLMPAVQTSRIREAMKHWVAPKVMAYVLKSDNDYVKFKLAIVEDYEGNKRVFASNFELLINDNAQNLFRLYADRWGIETSYRMKGLFRAKTTSKNYVVRLFYFLFSVLLYNLWILINVVVCKALFERIREKPLITAKWFGTVLYTFVDPGGG